MLRLMTLPLLHQPYQLTENVRVWNTELALVGLGRSNFRTKLANKKRSKLLNEDVVDEDLMVGFEGEEDDEENVKEDLPDVIPSEELLETLIAMGFEMEESKKALILTNNLNIDSAISKIDALRDEAKNAVAKVQEKPQEVAPG